MLVEGRFFELVYLVIIGFAMYYYSKQAKEGKVPEIRRLPALDAVDEAIGRCAEMDRPIFFTVGSADISDESSAPTIAGLTLPRYCR